MKISNLTIMFSALILVVSTSPYSLSAEEEKKGLARTVVGEVTDAVGGTVKGVGSAVKGVGTLILGNEDVVKVRKEIDDNSSQALDRLLKSSSVAKALFEKSYAYAVFDTRKISLLLTSGGGAGVVVEKTSDKRTYMRMATAGAGLGLGAQFFNVIFLFENQDSVNKFIQNGWEANAAASAVFGKNSLDINARFVEGLAVFHLNESGIMADLNLTGTKYWKSEELNKIS